MSSEIVCPHCDARYPARADLYGRRVACKACKQVFTPEAPSNEPSPNEIACPHCDARYPARPDLYGRRVACKKCKQAFTPEAPVASDGDFAVSSLLDDAISESAQAERVEREPDPEAEKPKKKTKKKKTKQRGSMFSFASASLGDLFGTHVLVTAVLLLLGGPTLFALLSNSRETVVAALMIAGLCVQVTALWALWTQCMQEGGPGIVMFLAGFFCGPLGFILVLSFLISNIEDCPQAALAYFGGIACAITMMVKLSSFAAG